MSLFDKDEHLPSSSDPFECAQTRNSKSTEDEDEAWSSERTQTSASLTEDQRRRTVNAYESGSSIMDLHINHEEADDSCIKIPLRGGDLKRSRSQSRPNKFIGAPSTWRGWTAEERRLAASLDQLKARDLSTHLYNAHALKRRAKEIYRKQHRDKADLRRGEIWEPTKAWTAWPMSKAEVPRFGGSPKHAREILKTSDELEDVLLGEALKEAKSRFLARRSEDDELGTAADGIEWPPKKADNQKSSSNKSTSEVAPPPLDAVILADDEIAMKTLQPTLRQVIAKLDDLLMGLHHARHTHLPLDDDSGAQTDVDDEVLAFNGTTDCSQNDMEERGRPPSRQSMSLGRGASSGYSPPNLTARRVSRPSTASSVSKRRRGSLFLTSHARLVRKRPLRLGHRDWSDVLGTASIAGWDPAILENTAKRCEALFGEGMKFRTLEEGIVGARKTSILPNYTLRLDEEFSSSDDETKMHDISSDSVPVLESYERNRSGSSCPVPGCQRPPHASARSSNWLKHMKEMHGDREVLSDYGDASEEMYGGVHIDGYLEPIHAKREWLRRGTLRRGPRRIFPDHAA